jgi:putative DNA primase/helicase
MSIDVICETTESRRAFDALLKNEEPTYEETVLELSKLKPYEYDRKRREKAKSLNVQLSTLEADVKEARQGRKKEDSAFTDIEPYPTEIVPGELLDDVTNTILRFIVLDKYQAQLAALWVAACWFLDEIETAPIALINAPEKACGKTQLLTLLSRISPRPAQASGITPSCLFRMIEAHQPTLFIDEIETVLKDNEPLRGLLNAGHTRSSATVWRSVSVGDDFEPKSFNTFGMKAIAGINATKLASTVTDRSIILELRRKKPNEKAERLRQAEPELFNSISSKFARFSEDYTGRMKKNINLPDELSDRAQDNFEPLFLIADLAGGHWTESVRTAALTLSRASSNELSISSELLESIKEIFEKRSIYKIHTTDLVADLCKEEESPWLTYNRGKSISPAQIRKYLASYEIKSKDIRVGHTTKRGYELSQFEDVFSRYLSPPPDIPLQRYKSIEANDSNGSSVANTNNVAATESQSATPKPLPIIGCSNVAENSGVKGKQHTKSSHIRI